MEGGPERTHTMRGPWEAVAQGRASPGDALESLGAILDLIRRGRAHSRSEIAGLTGLTRGVVAQRVGDLLARGLVTESMAPSTGGRPPRRLALRADAGHVLVADVGATSLDVAVADLAGRVLGHRDAAADVSAGPLAILSQVDDLADELLGHVAPPGPLWGVGIGLPGPVEFGSGDPVSPPIMPGWDRYPVRERYAARHGVPVWVDNDVNIMALGEWRAGVARGHANVIVVKVGTGIGAGIISDGALHRGAQGSAGDIGHIRIPEASDELCRCGNTGCLEAVAGGAALGRDGEALARSGRSATLAERLAAAGRVTARDVARAAQAGDPRSLELLQASGRRVGGVLAGLVNFFNPSLIVIGGGVAEAGDAYLAAIREVVYARSLPLATRELLIRFSALGGLAGITGAATMVLDQLFAPRTLGAWIAAGRPDASIHSLLPG